MRKQRVVLRRKRREQLKHHLRGVLFRSVGIALVVGFGVGLASGGDSFLSRFVRRHTPQVTVEAPQALAGLPVFSELPAGRFWLWIPGSAIRFEKRVLQKYPGVRGVRFERRYGANRIVVRLEPREPLVIWNGAGLDRDGVVFPVAPGTWAQLPQADFSGTFSKAALGRWLAELAPASALWERVARVSDDRRGQVQLTLKTGTLVLWGPPDPDGVPVKARTLARILDDAHEHLGGTALADLRFFDEGRIIVRPKSVRG